MRRCDGRRGKREEGREEISNICKAGLEQSTPALSTPTILPLVPSMLTSAQQQVYPFLLLSSSSSSYIVLLTFLPLFLFLFK